MMLLVVACEPPRMVVRAAVTPPPEGVRVALALGAVNGVGGTSSMEAFRVSYRRGFRWFATEASSTADGVLVCVTPGSEAWLQLPSAVNELTLPVLLAARIHRTYRPLSVLMLLEQLRRHPDTRLLLTLHPFSEQALSRLHDTIDRVDPALRRRLAVTCSSSVEAALATRVESTRGPLGFVALRTVALPAPEVLGQLVSAHRVAVVILPLPALSSSSARAVHAAGARLLVHPVNLEDEALSAARAGADGILTDVLAPPPPPEALPRAATP